MQEILAKAIDSFKDMPILVDDGELLREIGRISVLEIIDLKKNCLVLRLGDTKEMKALGERVLGRLAEPAEGHVDDLLAVDRE